MTGKLNLLADCENCFGLCCVALPFAAGADFAIDKNGGEPCGNLQSDFSFGIHQNLRTQGFKGCTVCDCFGAGQKVSQETFDGRDWRRDTRTAGQMFAVFPLMRQLHELLWYLTEALTLPETDSIHPELTMAFEETEELTLQGPDGFQKLDVEAQRAAVNLLLLRTSELVRAGLDGTDHRGDDLMGAQLSGADLLGANLRGAYLIGTNLRGADLRRSDLIGADLRDADISGADLTGSIFLTQSQVNSATGDPATKLPFSLTRPSHWA